MYSTQESVIKDHYTITLSSMSPIPNGGFIFEVHKDRIFVIDGAKFKDNLAYLLSMGGKSLANILGIEPQEKLTPFSEWLENHQNQIKKSNEK
jgi:uncharacterized membrane protein